MLSSNRVAGSQEARSAVQGGGLISHAWRGGHVLLRETEPDDIDTLCAGPADFSLLFSLPRKGEPLATASAETVRFCLAPKGELAKRPPGDGRRWLLLELTTEALFECAGEYWRPGLTLVRVDDSSCDVLGPLALMLAEALEERNTFAPGIVEHAVVLITLNGLRLYSNAHSLALHKGGIPPRILRRVVEYINHMYTEPITLEHLAKVAGLSVPYFSHAFKSSVGVAPYRYILKRRVEAAAEMLVTTAMPVAEIALAAGFAHQPHMTTIFRQLTGTTPKAYRRAHAM